MPFNVRPQAITKMQTTVSFAEIILMASGNYFLLNKLSQGGKASILPPSLVITTTVEPGPAPLGLMTWRETRYWV